MTILTVSTAADNGIKTRLNHYKEIDVPAYAIPVASRIVCSCCEYDDVLLVL